MNRRKFPYLLAAGSVSVLLIQFIMGNSGMGEFYALHIYPKISVVLSLAASPFAFSLQTLIIAILAVVFVYIIILNLRKKTGFLKLVLSVITFFVWLYVWLYMGWCLNYSRAPITVRAEIESVQYDSLRFRNFIENFVSGANAAYVSVDVVDKASVEEKGKDFYRDVPAKYGLSKPRSWHKSKPMPFSGIMSSMGILGYIGPLFNEFHLNKDIPVLSYPFTWAHEYAHLLGVSSEAEANWWAYNCCLSSDDPAIRYSAYMGILPHIFSNAYGLLSQEDFTVWSGTIRQEILDDYNANREFWRLKRNKTLDKMQKSLYDLFLRSNKISSGTKNYAEVVSLLIFLDY